METRAVSDISSVLRCPPINIIYLHYHNAIRSELDRLSESVSKLEKSLTAKVGEQLAVLKTQYRFLEKVYRYHSSVEDEVVYPALSSKVRNVTLAYSVEHEAEERLFDELMPLLNQALLETDKQQAATVRRLVCKVEEIHKTLRKHLAKEEDQLFPLLLKHFTFAEQAELVAQFLCCIPLAGIDAVLSWLKSEVPHEEQKQLLAEVRHVISDQLLLQMLVDWLQPLPLERKKVLQPAKENAEAKAGKRAAGEKAVVASKSSPDRPPLKEISYFHEAIRSAMESFKSEAQALQRRKELSSPKLAALADRHRFLRSVCSYHQASEDEILFPAVRDLRQPDEALASCDECEVEHTAEVGTWEKLGRLLSDLKACSRRRTHEAAALMKELCEGVDAACAYLSSHMQREEMQILPVLERNLGAAEQRSMVWGTLMAMPLRLLERVMPWLTRKLSEEESAEMLANMRLAAPQDVALVQLLSRWAKRGRRPKTPEPEDPDDPSCYANHTCEVKSCHGKRPAEEDELGSEGGEPAWKRARGTSEEPRDRSPGSEAAPAVETESAGDASGSPDRADDEPRINPIDHIFQFHKALKRELKFMEGEALQFAAALENEPANSSGLARLSSQLEGRFRFLCGIYRAHSEAEDEVVFPALESKKALRNVSHAYTLDHQHESELFAEVEQDIPRRLNAAQVLHRIRGLSDIGELRAEAAALQRMCAAMRATLHEHVDAEELELWPLFAEYFSVAEQEDIVGMIIGRTGAEVLQAMLPWVTVSFTDEEQRAMMHSFRSASKNTMFGQWLDATQQAPAGGEPGSPPRGATVGAREAAQDREAAQLPLADLAQYLAEDKIGNVSQRQSPPGVVRPSIEGAKDSSRDAGALKDNLAFAQAAIVPVTDAAVQASDAEGKLASPTASAFKPGWQDIFRMNQKQLETAVRRMQSDPALEPDRKAYLMQNIMASRYIVAQQCRLSESRGATSGAPKRTYHDARTQTLGCPHYKRKCQVVAGCCGKAYSCRHCHDAAEDHRLEPQKATEMVCMLCSTRQPAAAECRSCGERMARYYCGICRLWDDQPGRSIYHCPFCNLCRRGRGLGVDACHCMHCNTCMHLSEFKQHTCRDISTCPICTEILFDSTQPYRELVCGHFMHSHCFAQYTRYDYTCPICCKSLGDMRVYFRMVDTMVARDRTTLPQAYLERKQEVLCNDCERRGMTDFHFVYHKCPHCASYNTRLV